MCECVLVRNRRPHRLTPRAEICHGGPHPPVDGQETSLSFDFELDTEPDVELQRLQWIRWSKTLFWSKA